MLRGSRELASRDEYTKFLDELLRQRNAGRQSRLQEEQAVPRPLPVRRYESWRRVRARVELAYDALTEHVPERAVREYLAILELAARDVESLVDDARDAQLRAVSAGTDAPGV